MLSVVSIVAALLSSCAVLHSVPPEVDALADLLGKNWKDEETEDAIFAGGTNALHRLWKLQETDGYSDDIYERARHLARWLENRDGLSIVEEDQLFSGALPIAHPDLNEAVRLVIPLLVQSGQESKWKHEKTVITDDGTRALVRCCAVYGPLDGKGWVLVFAKQKEVWTLTLIEQDWVS